MTYVEKLVAREGIEAAIGMILKDNADFLEKWRRMKTSLKDDAGRLTLMLDMEDGHVFPAWNPERSMVVEKDNTLLRIETISYRNGFEPEENETHTLEESLRMKILAYPDEIRRKAEGLTEEKVIYEIIRTDENGTESYVNTTGSREAELEPNSEAEYFGKYFTGEGDKRMLCSIALTFDQVLRNMQNWKDLGIAWKASDGLTAETFDVSVPYDVQCERVGNIKR